MIRILLLIVFVLALLLVPVVFAIDPDVVAAAVGTGPGAVPIAIAGDLYDAGLAAAKVALKQGADQLLPGVAKNANEILTSASALAKAKIIAGLGVVVKKNPDKSIEATSSYLKGVAIAGDAKTASAVAKAAEDVLGKGKDLPEKFSILRKKYLDKRVDVLKTSAGENQLVKIFKDSNGVVTVGDKQIDEVTLLVIGDNTYGWTHIYKKHITGVIPEGDLFPVKLGTSDEKIIQRWVEESIEHGTPEYLSNSGKWIYTYEPLGDGRQMKTVVKESFNAGGNIQSRILSAYPVH